MFRTTRTRKIFQTQQVHDNHDIYNNIKLYFKGCSSNIYPLCIQENIEGHTGHIPNIPVNLYISFQDGPWKKVLIPPLNNRKVFYLDICNTTNNFELLLRSILNRYSRTILTPITDNIIASRLLLLLEFLQCLNMVDSLRLVFNKTKDDVEVELCNIVLKYFGNKDVLAKKIEEYNILSKFHIRINRDHDDRITLFAPPTHEVKQINGTEFGIFEILLLQGNTIIPMTFFPYINTEIINDRIYRINKQTTTDVILIALIFINRIDTATTAKYIEAISLEHNFEDPVLKLFCVHEHSYDNDDITFIIKSNAKLFKSFRPRSRMICCYFSPNNNTLIPLHKINIDSNLKDYLFQNFRILLLDKLMCPENLF